MCTEFYLKFHEEKNNYKLEYICNDFQNYISCSIFLVRKQSCPPQKYNIRIEREEQYLRCTITILEVMT